MRQINDWRKVGMGVSITLLVAGCTFGSTIGLVPQSHFDFPNSNIYPLNHVSGSATQFSMFVPPQLSADLKDRAISDALAESSEGELLVNYTETSKITVVPLLYLNLYFLTYKVEGTAARMVIGTQGLR